jgi:poly(A) polymerase
LSRRETTRLIAMASLDDAPSAAMAPSAMRRMLHRDGASLVRDRVLLAWAGVRAQGAATTAGDSRAWTELLDQADAWQPLVMPVAGADVRAAGIESGPEVGRILAMVERLWQDGDFRAGRQELLAMLDAVVAECCGREGNSND